MSSRQTLASFLAVLSIVWGPAAGAQPADVNLTGVVRDASQAPLPGVTVTATDQARDVPRTATTAADGRYTLALPPGSYSVKASLTGYRTVSVSAEVVAGSENQLDFSLEAGLSEAITVTAQKREAELINVPFSVAAPTEQELRDRGAENVEAVAANVGGFTVQNLGPGQSQVAMRGVSAGQIVRDQPGVKEQVGIYLDESPVSLSLFTPDLDLVDVGRVEVLRGPQGTLFGAGSLTGTVRYISNPPVLGTTEGFVELGVNALTDGGVGGNVKAGVNLPLGDKAAARVVGYFTRTAGYVDSVQPDESVDEDVNSGLRAGGRLAVRFEPTEQWTITPRLVYQRAESGGWNRYDAYNILYNPFTTTRPGEELGEREQFTQLDEDYTDDFVLGDLTVSYDLGNLDLTSVSSYVVRDILVIRDTTQLTASFTGGNLGLPPQIYTLDSPLYDESQARVFTQELRVAGNLNGLQVLFGAFYGHSERDYGQTVFVHGFEAATGIPTQGLRAPRDSLFFSDLAFQLDQFALFGEATYWLTDRLSVTGGLRYYNFQEDKQQIFDGVFGNPDNGNSLVSQPGSTNADGFAPRLIAAYQLSSDLTVNAQVSRGFRLGGINDPLNVPLCTPEDLETFGGRETWEDETVWNYETGVKTRFLGGNGSFNLSAFHIDISDLQATVTAGSCSSRVVFNVPDSRSRGLEFDFELAPNRSFDLTVSGSYTDSELGSTLTSTDADGNETIVAGIEEGRRLPSVPKFQLAASATYQFELSSDSLLYLTGTYQHMGSRFTQVGDDELGTLDLTLFGPNAIGGPLDQSTFTYDPELPAYDLLNARVGLRRVKWEISAYVNNLTDEIAFLSFDRERGTLARVGFLTNQPRTFGISTRYSF